MSDMGEWLLKNSFSAKLAKITLRQDALQTTFSVFLGIFYPPKLCCLDENGVFQHQLAISLIDRVSQSQ